MKKLVSIVLAIAICLSVVAAASAEKDIPEAYTYSCVPIPDTLGEAEIVYTALEESPYIVAYAPIDADLLDEYLQLCASLGAYPYYNGTKDDAAMYLLCSPVEGVIGRLMVIDDILYVQFLEDTNIMMQDNLDNFISYFDQDLKFPADMGRLVFPQFFASAELGISSMPGSVIPNAFGSTSAWMEQYTGVSYIQLRKYIDEMLLCGFQVSVSRVKQEESGEITQITLLLTRDECEISVSFNVLAGAPLGSANAIFVSYKAGVIYTLLSGADYERYIPTRK